MTIEVNIKNLAKHTKMISKFNMNLIFKLLFNIHPLSCLVTIFYSVSHFIYTVIASFQLTIQLMQLESCGALLNFPCTCSV